MRFVSLIVFMGYILLTPATALATAQIPELLVYEGKEEAMFSCPEIPESNSRVRVLSEEEFHGKIADETINPIISSTACWRQYFGSWEIKDKGLFLISITGRLELAGEGPLFADWFSGALRIPKGEQLEYVHMGFESVYEEDLIIYVENGVVTNTEIIDNRKKQHGGADI